MTWQEELMKEKDDIVGGDLMTQDEKGIQFRGPIDDVLIKDGEVKLLQPRTYRKRIGSDEEWAPHWDKPQHFTLVSELEHQGRGILRSNDPRTGYATIFMQSSHQKLESGIQTGGI